MTAYLFTQSFARQMKTPTGMNDASMLSRHYTWAKRSLKSSSIFSSLMIPNEISITCESKNGYCQRCSSPTEAVKGNNVA